MRRRLVAAALGATIASAHYPGANRGYRGMSEKERVDYFHKNGYEWPPTSTRGWPPRPATPSDAYRRSRDEIEAWIRRNLTTYKATFDEWGTLSQSRRMPAFTRNGFEVFDLSHTASYAELAANYERNVNDPAAFANLRPEGMSSGSSTGRPKFYHQGSLNNRLLDELRPRMEAWAGVELRNGQAYGVRVYGNGSTLVNHIDRSETHVVSAIFHIDHDLDHPWPLEIEDHDGAWHRVNLKPGELCMYESAKQYHARLQPMRGRAYASVFLHWFPKHGWNWTMWDTHVSVPADFEATRPGDAARAGSSTRPARRRSSGPTSPLARPGLRGAAAPPGHRGPRAVLRRRRARPADSAGATRRGAPTARGSGVRQDGRLDDARARDLDNVDVDAADDNGWAPIHEPRRGEDAGLLGARRGREAHEGRRRRAALARDAHGPDHAAVAYLARVHSELIQRTRRSMRPESL
ncbi:hypothetical protein JL721_4657 [Aureococcus anophagefferens]|nr:hypothetical protein JL721_4657 [Aureococcus anophagefferens]